MLRFTAQDDESKFFMKRKRDSRDWCKKGSGVKFRMNSICYTCGDRGTANEDELVVCKECEGCAMLTHELVICKKCEGMTVHRYYTRVVLSPEEEWSCEYCEDRGKRCKSEEDSCVKASCSAQTEPMHSEQETRDPRPRINDWQGFFKIHDTLWVPLVGRKASKSRVQDRDVSKLLPQFISVEKITCPGRVDMRNLRRRDVDLFFFPHPGDLRTQKKVNQIVKDMVNGNHMLRFKNKDTELYIFSTHIFPEATQRKVHDDQEGHLRCDCKAEKKAKKREEGDTKDSNNKDVKTKKQRHYLCSMFSPAL